MRKLFFFIFALALVPGSAHAYIDPGMGSMVLQGIIAAVVGGLVVVKMYWQRIVDTVFKRSRSIPSEKDLPASDE